MESIIYFYNVIVCHKVMLYLYYMCRCSYIRLYVAKLKVVCLTLDSWWSLLTPVVCQIIKYISGLIGDRKRTKQTHNMKHYAEKPSFCWPVLSQIA